MLILAFLLPIFRIMKMRMVKRRLTQFVLQPILPIVLDEIVYEFKHQRS